MPSGFRGGSRSHLVSVQTSYNGPTFESEKLFSEYNANFSCLSIDSARWHSSLGRILFDPCELRGKRVSFKLRTEYLFLMSKNVLFAVDPSLTASGWAAFSLESAKPFAVGVLKPPGPSVSLERRIRVLQDSVEQLFEDLSLEKGDFLVCEGPAPLLHNAMSVMKMERVRGVFETVARSRGVCVPGRLNPRTVQTELLGLKGKQLTRSEVKQSAREVVEKLFAAEFAKMEFVGSSKPKKNSRLQQDIVDALLIGALAVSRTQFSVRSGIEVEEVFAPRAKSLSPRSPSRAARWSESDLKSVLEGS